MGNNSSRSTASQTPKRLLALLEILVARMLVILRVGVKVDVVELEHIAQVEIRRVETRFVAAN